MPVGSSSNLASEERKLCCRPSSRFQSYLCDRIFQVVYNGSIVYCSRHVLCATRFGTWPAVVHHVHSCWSRRLMSTASTITLLLTIRSWMSVVVAMIRWLLLGNLNAVSQISITGCRHTALSKIQRRQNSCGRVPSTVWVNSMVVARQSSLALTPLSPVDTHAS